MPHPSLLIPHGRPWNSHFFPKPFLADKVEEDTAPPPPTGISDESKRIMNDRLRWGGFSTCSSAWHVLFFSRTPLSMTSFLATVENGKRALVYIIKRELQYMAVCRYECYFFVVKKLFYERAHFFHHSKLKFISSRHRAASCKYRRDERRPNKYNHQNSLGEFFHG